MLVLTKQMRRILLFCSITGMASLIYYTFYIDQDLLLKQSIEHSKKIRHLVYEDLKQPTPEKISINSATLDELTLIPGVGPKTAEKIILYRKNKKFSLISDILKIKGIGKKKFQKLKKHISL